jgi:hypothetical protein
MELHPPSKMLRDRLAAGSVFIDLSIVFDKTQILVIYTYFRLLSCKTVIVILKHDLFSFQTW